MTDSYLTNGDTQVVLTSGHCSHQAGTRCNDTPAPSTSTQHQSKNHPDLIQIQT